MKINWFIDNNLAPKWLHNYSISWHYFLHLKIASILDSVTNKFALKNSELVEEVQKDLNRLQVVTDRFSKIGSIPELKKENIVPITKQAFDYLKSRSSKQISFSFIASQNEINTHLNSELYSWVIENMIKNSIDAMSGKGALTVKIEATSKKIKIMISDSGKGIPKKLYKLIFKPGFTTKKRGWGLGLSLSKRIVQDYHKGKIVVQKSEINKGTTFEILLDIFQLLIGLI